MYRGRCELHRGEAEGGRGDSTQRGYDWEWERVRKLVLQRSDRCERCRVVRPVIVHHIVPVDVTPDLRLDPANMLAVCRKCHGAIHKEMESR